MRFSPVMQHTANQHRDDPRKDPPEHRVDQTAEHQRQSEHDQHQRNQAITSSHKKRPRTMYASVW